MILHTVEIRPVAGYRLFVAFDNGEAGEVDLTEALTGEMFEPLRDAKLFATARQHPLFKTVIWDNGADLAPEYLLDLLHAQHENAKVAHAD